MIAFRHYGFALRREPFVRPFHFKGGSFNEKWLNITSLSSGEPDGDRLPVRQTAIGGNAVLWSDSAVFAAHSETGGNMLMSLMAERAVQLLQGKGFPDPIAAINILLPQLHDRESGTAVDLHFERRRIPGSGFVEALRREPRNPDIR